MLFGILIALFLVALNGFFVAAEFAIVKVRVSQLEVRARSGATLPKIALHIVQHLDAYLSACQLGITLASLGLGWIGEQVVSGLLLDLFRMLGLNWSETIAHAIAIPFAFALITLLHIVYGELAPKSIAIRYAEVTTLAVAVPLRGFYIIFRPLISLFNGLANLSLRIFGIPSIVGHDVHSEEELRLLLRHSRDIGQLARDEHALIERVFRFRDRVVRQAMVPRNRMIAVEVGTTKQALFDRFMAEGYSRLPVYEGNRDRVIGFVHTKDVLKASEEHGPFSLREKLHPVHFVPESKPLGDFLREMQSKRVQMAMVVDEYGSTVGLITMEDIVEELVGEIQDEYDEERAPVERRGESEFVIDASAPISDVNLLLPVPIPEDPECDSVAGLLIKMNSGLPEHNQAFRLGDYHAVALEVSPVTVVRALLKLNSQNVANS